MHGLCPRCVTCASVCHHCAFDLQSYTSDLQSYTFMCHRCTCDLQSYAFDLQRYASDLQSYTFMCHRCARLCRCRALEFAELRKESTRVYQTVRAFLAWCYLCHAGILRVYWGVRRVYIALEYRDMQY